MKTFKEIFSEVVDTDDLFTLEIVANRCMKIAHDQAVDLSESHFEYSSLHGLDYDSVQEVKDML